MIFDFIDGAAGNESAVARNAAAIAKIELQPRVLRDINNRSLRTQLLGREWGLPFGIAPMGMCALSWPGTDQAYGRVANERSIPHCLSTAASTSLEDCRRLAGENAWFQLYISNVDAGWALVDRAEKAGYEHLILTVDTPLISRRRRELRRGFKVPFVFGPSQVLDFALHPQWSIATLLNGAPRFGNNDPTADANAQAFSRGQSRGGIEWDFLAELRDRWKGKLIVKGVLSADDAVCIKASGADAIYVSNHGGRQLASVPPAITLLPGIRAAVGADYPLIFDSGVRDGEDIVKALAMGADFVMLGRPFLYAAGAAGALGVERMVELLVEETHATLAQIGCRDINSLDATVLSQKP